MFPSLTLTVLLPLKIKSHLWSKSWSAAIPMDHAENRSESNFLSESLLPAFLIARSYREISMSIIKIEKLKIMQNKF